MMEKRHRLSLLPPIVFEKKPGTQDRYYFPILLDPKGDAEGWNKDDSTAVGVWLAPPHGIVEQ